MSDSSEFVTNNLKISGHASQASVYVVAVCFTVLSCLVVLARLLTRIMIVRQPGLDDAFIAAACVGNVLYVGRASTLTNRQVFSTIMAVSICKQGMPSSSHLIASTTLLTDRNSSIRNGSSYVVIGT